MISARRHNHQLPCFKAALASSVAILFSVFCGRAVNYETSNLVPPKPVREFRGVWIATVANVDWPSRPGLSTAEQKRELTAILDRAAQLKLNVVVFQVRPACDAMYASSLEPWSEYLTGIMGKAPAPFYDPLAFAVEEAHKRGLELHAWFNPFRALHFSSRSRIAPNHISRTHPELVKRYGQYLWLDPGEPEVQDHSLKVVMDVVRRYNIDGVQFDDYFYPSEHDASGRDLEFPDEASWQKCRGTTDLSRDDWRRENVNQFVKRVYLSIKGAKPQVKFGISPFGIWRPGQPQPIRGTDAYAKFYADSRKWLVNGWVDYFAPQLYWPIESREQSFPVLLTWWAQQNPKNRLLCVGISAANAGKWKPDEVPKQIRLARSQSGVDGYILYNASSLLYNASLTAALAREINRQPALVPTSPQPGSIPPGKPELAVTDDSLFGTRARWQSAVNGRVQLWLLQYRTAGVWTTETLPADHTWYRFNGVAPDAVAASAVDRLGNLGPPAVAAVAASARVRVPEARPTLDKPKPRRIHSPKSGG